MNRPRLPWYLVLAMLICGTAAVVASFYFLAALAGWAGWPGQSRWLFPLTVDALGGACLVVWMRPGFADAARRIARAYALIAILSSAVFNALSHVVALESGRPGWEIGLAVVVGAIPPIALAGIVEVAVLVMGPALKRRGNAKPTVSTTAPADVKVDPEPVEQPAAREVGEASEAKPQVARLQIVPDADDRAWVEKLNDRHLEEYGKPITRAKLQEWLKAERQRGMNNQLAGELLREVREATG